LFVSFSVFPVNAGTRLFAAMKIKVLRDIQASSGSANVELGYQQIGAGGSSESSASGSVIGVLFGCSFAFADCETSEQQYVAIDSDAVRIIV
jgi:hypothetical protein